jgi:hypothetical protein
MTSTARWGVLFVAFLLGCHSGALYGPGTPCPCRRPLVCVEDQCEMPDVAVKVADGIASNLEVVDEMALSRDYLNLRWMLAGIFHVPKYGGDAVAVDADPSLFFLTLTARDGTVVWTRSAFSVDGDAHPVQVVKQTGLDPPALVAEVQMEYLSPYLNPAQQGADTLYLNARFGGVSGFYAVTLATGDFKLVSAFRQAPYHTLYWLVAEPYIYYVEYSDDITNPDCGVRRVSVYGGPPEDVLPCAASAPVPTWFIAADDTDVYMASTQSHWKVPRAGGAATMIYQADDPSAYIDPGTAVLDAQKLYFAFGAHSSATQIPFKLMSTPKAGGISTVIYDGPSVRDGIRRLAQDENNLYMVTYFGVASVPKVPPAP